MQTTKYDLTLFSPRKNQNNHNNNQPHPNLADLHPGEGPSCNYENQEKKTETDTNIWEHSTIQQQFLDLIQLYYDL